MLSTEKTGEYLVQFFAIGVARILCVNIEITCDDYLAFVQRETLKVLDKLIEEVTGNIARTWSVDEQDDDGDG